MVGRSLLEDDGVEPKEQLEAKPSPKPSPHSYLLEDDGVEPKEQLEAARGSEAIQVDSESTGGVRADGPTRRRVQDAGSPGEI